MDLANVRFPPKADIGANDTAGRDRSTGETVGTTSRFFRFCLMSKPIPKEVLVVEDEAMIRIVAADALADFGIMAWEAGNANEALEALSEHPSIRLLFTDVDMPGDMNGLELARRVHQERPDVELVVTSGAVSLADGDLPDHGTFLPKPYPMDRLVHVVAAKLDDPG